LSNLKKVFSSSFLLSFEAILRKMVGLVSTLILARLLVPEDFGLIAIALMVMGFIDAMKQFGGHTYLLKSDTINVDMINTAWTISAIANSIMAVLLILAAPYISSYYDDPRLESVLWAFAGIWIIRSLGNPALVMLRRAQNYLPIVKLSIITKIAAVIVVIISAVVFESYWALVLGQLTTYSLMTIGGYFLYHHKTRFCLSGFKEQWNFSGWWMLQSIVGFTKAQLDTFLVSSMFNKSALGSYHTIKYFASMPTTFFLEPITKPLLVQLRSIKDNKPYFNQQFNITLTVALLIATPLTTFLIKEHYLVTATLLGVNWLEYSELFAIFCISITTYVIQQQASNIIVILGKAKGIFYFQVVSFIAVYGVLLLQGITDITTFATTKVWMEALVVLGLFLFVVVKYTSTKNIANFVVSITPIFISNIISYLLILDTNPEQWVFIQLVIKTLNFFIVYAICLLLLALLFKRFNPEWKYIWALGIRFMSSNLLKKEYNKS
jgi:O-antigen/teichoic acid export membrane protein